MRLVGLSLLPSCVTSGDPRADGCLTFFVRALFLVMMILLCWPCLRSVFCHNTSLAWSAHEKVAPFASLTEGDEVEFEYSQGARGTEAVKVTAVAQHSTRRKGTVVQFSDEKGYGFIMDNQPESIEGKQGASLFAPSYLSLADPGLLSHGAPQEDKGRNGLQESQHRSSCSWLSSFETLTSH